MGDLFKPKTKEEANMPKRVFLTLMLIASLLSLIWLASSQLTASKKTNKGKSFASPFSALKGSCLC
jgi:hypothetical protein